MEKGWKRVICLLLCLALTLSISYALADPYKQHEPNEATIETIEEVHTNALSYMQKLYPTKNLSSDPALDNYPQGTTFVYRSAGMFNSDTAADRMNTNIIVYTDKTFANKQEALTYMQDLGLTAFVDEATGSIVLVTPIDSKKGFDQADQAAYYLLQSVMCNINFMSFGPNGLLSMADPGYFGGVAFRYLIGIDGGATFLNNYVASTFDYISRIAGMILINGSMEHIRKVAAPIPVCIFNGSEESITKYCTANETNATEETKQTLTYFNQQLPLQRVSILKDNALSVADAINYAYYQMFIHTMRLPVIRAGLYTPIGEYNNHNFNQAPYSLASRNAIINGQTADGIYVIEHQEDRFNSILASNGEYLNTWFEFLPEEVVNGTAAEHSIPLILANHGGGDDPVQAVDNLGLTTIAGRERVAIVAPRYASDVPGSSVMSPSPYDTNSRSLPALVRYMLETYPQLDPSRVYVTGYSMGGSATIQAVAAAPGLFAAAMPMAAATPKMTESYIPTEEEAASFSKWDIPIMFCTSSFDLPACINQAAGTLGNSYMEHINRFLSYNEMNQIEFDFNAYPLVGFEADRVVKILLNNEYSNTTWYLNSKDGVPMVAVSFTEFLPHGLYPEYGNLFWNYVKHFSRNQETGQIVYDPYVE